MKYADRDKLVASLREFADFIEEHGVELPINDIEQTFNVWLFDDYFPTRISAREKATRAARGLHGAEKVWQTDYLDLRKKFGCLTLEFTVNRNAVCERIVVGTEVVPEQVVKGYTREIVEWKCDDALLA